MSTVWGRYLPPARVVWISLSVLTVYGGGFVSWQRAEPFLPMLAAGALTDLGFQRARFTRLRFPDAALATSLFLVLILWPATVSLALASLAVAAVGIRHIARFQGHPLLNPAATGVTVGFLLFGVSTSWHVSVSSAEYPLVLGLGLLNLIRAPRTWRLPASFFASYVPLMLVVSVLAGGSDVAGRLLTTGALSATPMFYGLFMVTEPRTAPSGPRAMPAYGALVGVAAAGFPMLFNGLPLLGALGVVAPFLALFAGNGLTILISRTHGRGGPPARSSQRDRSAELRKPQLASASPTRSTGSVHPAAPEWGGWAPSRLDRSGSWP